MAKKAATDTAEDTVTGGETPEMTPIGQIAQSCIVVFEYVGKTIPSNYKKHIDDEIEKLKPLVK